MSIEFTTAYGSRPAPAPTFEAMTFPAGEAHVKVAADNPVTADVREIAVLRGADAADLLTLGMWADAVRQRGGQSLAVIPYLPGARQDRGLPFGARVYADVLNGFGIDRIVAFDAHSPVMPSLIRRLTVIDSAEFIAAAAAGLQRKVTGVIAPDAGAQRRARAAADAIGVPMYQGAKHRDPATGDLSGFACEPLDADGYYLVVDDICDGGGTFCGLAEATGLPRDGLALWVSHGVFTGNASRLTDHYSTVITTDSFPAITEIPGLITVPLVSDLIGRFA